MSKLLRALVVSAIVAASPVAAVAAEPAAQIRVVAQATVSAKPDQAELELGVTTDKKTAAAAVAENEQKMSQLVAALKKEVGADGDIKTSALTVSPRYDESRSGQAAPHVAGYTVANRVHVRVANVKGVGRLLDVAFQAGANTVEQVSFTLKDPEAAQNQALRAASVKARARATAIADGQGLRVGDVVSLSEGEGAVPFDRAFAMEGVFARKSGNVTVEPGSVEVTATVTVTFALKAR